MSFHLLGHAVFQVGLGLHIFQNPDTPPDDDATSRLFAALGETLDDVDAAHRSAADELIITCGAYHAEFIRSVCADAQSEPRPADATRRRLEARFHKALSDLFESTKRPAPV